MVKHTLRESAGIAARKGCWARVKVPSEDHDTYVWKSGVRACCDTNRNLLASDKVVMGSNRFGITERVNLPCVDLRLLARPLAHEQSGGICAD